MLFRKTLRDEYAKAITEIDEDQCPVASRWDGLITRLRTRR